MDKVLKVAVATEVVLGPLSAAGGPVSKDPLTNGRSTGLQFSGENTSVKKIFNR